MTRSLTVLLAVSLTACSMPLEVGQPVLQRSHKIVRPPSALLVHQSRLKDQLYRQPASAGLIADRTGQNRRIPHCESMRNAQQGTTLRAFWSSITLVFAFSLLYLDPRKMRILLV